MIPMWLQAGLWGLFSGGALLIGAAIGYRVELSHRRIAGIMAFGAGVLISALCFELMEEAFKEGGLWATSIGFAAGALLPVAPGPSAPVCRCKCDHAWGPTWLPHLLLPLLLCGSPCWAHASRFLHISVA